MSRNTKRPNLFSTLHKRLPVSTFALLKAIVRQAEQQGAPIYLVGGFVRDLMLKRPNLDLDLVVEGDAIQLGRALVKRFGGNLVPHRAFNTAVWWLPMDRSYMLRKLRVTKKADRLPKFFDLITARRETYRYPGALPTIQFSGIRQDQYRRDFTINTLAIRLDGPETGYLLDPCDGVKDLQAKLLRTLHSASFSDDPTRILRIVRFAIRLNFRIEKQTRRQLKAHLPVLKELSGERIRTELELSLLERDRVAILRSMQKTGVLHEIHPKLRIPDSSVRALAAQLKPIPSIWKLADFSKSDLGFVLWLMYLLPADVADIADRLRFRADLRDAILASAGLRLSKKELSRIPTSAFVSRVEHLPDLSLYAVYLAENGSDLARRLKAYLSKWRHIFPRTDGTKLRKLGLKPGPNYKLILDQLRAAWLDGKIRSARQEQSLLQSLLNEHS